MKTGKIYERKDDNSPGKTLSVLRDSLGDIAVRITDYEKEPLEIFTVEFMTGAGGGFASNTREALQNLADAIEKDNKEHPMPPTPYYNPTIRDND